MIFGCKKNKLCYNVDFSIKNHVRCRRVCAFFRLVRFWPGGRKKLKGLLFMSKGVVSMKQLLESGVHFGHQTRRWNPKMAEYIYTKRNGIHIIDLQKTSYHIDTVYDFVKNLSEEKKIILFVGTKKQAKEAVQEEACRCGAPYVDSRWLGGTLTNLKTIRKRISRLEHIENMEADGTLGYMTKKESTKILLEKEKLIKKFGGIRKMRTLPDAIFVVDPKKEAIAVREARNLGIIVIAICDTNCDPTVVDYVIPANDDAVRSVKLLCRTMANAIIEGHEGEIPDENEKVNVDFSDIPDVVGEDFESSALASETSSDS